jgi:hypothetical protein
MMGVDARCDTALNKEDTMAEGLFYVHYRTPQHGTVTFALGAPVEGRPQAGWAFCAPRDQFSRKLGRRIASGRMEVLTEQFQGLEGYELCEQLIECLADERQQYEQAERGDGTVDPEPRIPRWFPSFALAAEAERDRQRAATAVH